MNLAFDHWHIEPSSICTLKCPRCGRNETDEHTINKQLSLQFFKKQIGEDTIAKIKKISFCGNDGDPIYCNDFLSIIEWIKNINPTLEIVIITNGSHKPSHWWEKLSHLLSDIDEIHWSIDGWDQESNNIYRINSDWNSIINGIKTFRKNNKETYFIWATIAFKFNENHIDKISNIAKEYDFDHFQLTLSTKFHSKYPQDYISNDFLEPDNKFLIAKGHRFDRLSTSLSDKKRPGIQLKKIFEKRANILYNSDEYPALCYIGNKGVFLNSKGSFFPCCWVANNYHHNTKWLSLGDTSFNLHKNTFSDIIDNAFWQNDFLKFDNLECKSKCTKEKLLDTQHTTEW